MNWRMIIRFSTLIVAAFLLGGCLTFLQVINKSSNGGGKTTFTIENGDGPRKVATNLASIGFLKAQRPFLLYVLLTGKRNRFYPGTYTLQQNQSIRSVVAMLTNPVEQQIKVTILEGWRINDIAQEIEEKTDVTASEFKKAAPVNEYEGYLFPDTYYFAPEATAPAIVKSMRDNFDRRTKDLTLTKEDVILASIVEREARTDEDRARVARVYLNRLAMGKALEADPTVQYGKGSWDPIRLADYRLVQSPYNTYLHAGLPPTPIASASLASLKAVKTPAEHGFIYFFHTNNGETYYSETLEEHNQNKAKYLR